MRTGSHSSGDDHPPFDRIEGNAFLELRLEPVSPVDLSEDEVRETYEGPTRIAIDGHAALEAMMVGDHHGSLAWVIGVTHEAPFAATLLSD